MGNDAPDWTRLTTLWDGTNYSTMYESVPIFKISELPSLSPGSADIGTINTKYFPTTPTDTYYKGNALTVGAGDATKTDTITLAHAAEAVYIKVQTTTPDSTNHFKIERYNAGDVLQQTLVTAAYDGIASEFPLKIPASCAADDYLKITYTNTAGAANVVVWYVGYLWTGVAASGSEKDSFDSSDTSPHDLAWDGTYLWNAGTAAGKINKHNATTGAIVTSFDAPSTLPCGLTYDGTNIWTSDRNTSKIYKLDPSDGSELLNFAAPGGDEMGLAWDGTYLWCTMSGPPKAYKLNPIDGSVIGSWTTPNLNPGGITWIAGYLYSTDSVENKVYKHNPIDGTVLTSFSNPAIQSKGLTWDSEYLRISSLDNDKIYRVYL